MTEGYFQQADEAIYKENTERLDEAIRKYTAENLARSGVITGWVLSVSSSRFDDDGYCLHSYDYSVGPDTPLPTAVGIVQLALWEMEEDIRRSARGAKGS